MQKKQFTTAMNTINFVPKFVFSIKKVLMVYIHLHHISPTPTDGKNDGTVKGKRYFHCRPSHGLFVKPEKATHRGINCAKILPDNLVEKTS